MTGPSEESIPPVEQKVSPTKSDRDRFLAWLDYDAERAEEACQKVLRRLVRVFRGWHLVNAEDLASDTLLRTMQKFVGGRYLDDRNAETYIREVAKRVRWEEFERLSRNKGMPITHEPVDPGPSPFDILTEREISELKTECLKELSPEHLRFIERYCQSDAKDRSQLAVELKITPNAMRFRAKYIRDLLTEIARRKARRSSRPKA